MMIGYALIAAVFVVIGAAYKAYGAWEDDHTTLMWSYLILAALFTLVIAVVIVARLWGASSSP